MNSIEGCGLLPNGVGETVQNEAKYQKGQFVEILLSTLGTSLLANIIAGKGITRAGYGSRGKGTIRVGYRSKYFQSKKTLILPDPLTYFKVQNIIRMSLDLMEIIPEKVCLIK